VNPVFSWTPSESAIIGADLRLIGGIQAHGSIDGGRLAGLGLRVNSRMARGPAEAAKAAAGPGYGSNNASNHLAGEQVAPAPNAR
jgi:hypothetical protein